MKKRVGSNSKSMVKSVNKSARSRNVGGAKMLVRMLRVFCFVTVVYNMAAMMSNNRESLPEHGIVVDTGPNLVDTKPHVAVTMPESLYTESSPSKAESSSIETNTTSVTTTPLPTKKYQLEHNVFQKLIERTTSVINTCHKTHSTDQKQTPTDFDTGVPPLPDRGMHDALQNWIRTNSGTHGRTQNYPVCQLPPSTSCHTSSYSVILMSHTIKDRKRLETMTAAIDDFALRPNTTEIVLVWNAQREVLRDSEDVRVKELLVWDQDTKHPLRIFYSFENGLGNNLMNRYHPSIRPIEEVVMYFDDDGPFFGEPVMDAGLELWKLYSDTQVGCMPRNIRFTSTRMQTLQLNTTTAAMKLEKEYAWETQLSPYDTSHTDTPDRNTPGPTRYPKFTPVCNKETGESVEYNFFDFPHFQANMFLPSGTILHRNFLCFIWHPAFAELRKYVTDHPTHPDDMMVSTLVSHLSGRVLRTFPRRIRNGTKRRLRQNGTRRTEVVEEGAADQQLLDDDGQRRRRLLWQQENWAKMREEALNSIVNYFGSVNPGSVGWCVGTQYEVRKEIRGKVSFNCNPEFPVMEQIPWIDEEGSGYDHCQ